MYFLEMPYHVGQKVNAYFESIKNPSLNGFYEATVERIIEEHGVATRYDIFYDDGDSGRLGSQHLVSSEITLPSGASVNELNYF